MEYWSIGTGKSDPQPATIPSFLYSIISITPILHNSNTPKFRLAYLFAFRIPN